MCAATATTAWSPGSSTTTRWPESFADGTWRPQPQASYAGRRRGEWRPLMRQIDRRIDWQQDSTAELAALRAEVRALRDDLRARAASDPLVSPRPTDAPAGEAADASENVG